MSEVAELHLLRQRMRQGALHKARRGELVSKVPIGYARTATGEVGLDPDEQVRSFVRLVFDQFERVGSAAGLLRWVVERELMVPVRADCGPDKGRLQWRRPNSTTLRGMLVHPMYAGAYVYGRSFQARGKPRRGRPQRLPPDQWQVLLRDHYPAYITWERYESNVARLAENRSLRARRGEGGPGAGGALLTRPDRRLRAVRGPDDDPVRGQGEPTPLLLRRGAGQLRGAAVPGPGGPCPRPRGGPPGAPPGPDPLRARGQLAGRRRPAGSVRAGRGAVASAAGAGPVRGRAGATAVRRRGAGEPAGGADAGGGGLGSRSWAPSAASCPDRHDRFLGSQPQQYRPATSSRSRSAAWPPTHRPSGSRRGRPTPTARRS